MDVATAEIRYQRWVQAIQGWSNSGLSKRDYCQRNNIDEKQYYYYQRRIRAIIAEQAKRPVLPEGGSELPTRFAEQQNNRPQIVKLRVSDAVQGSSSTISFSVNGIELSVPEDVPVSFLTKLLEAASHDEKYGNFAEVARQTGRAASTIARYINMKGVPKAGRHAAGRKIGK